ncbi:MAG: hypothetical protein LPK45_02420, partial [Bacteroidota bacterium]|nr:hypothetical protein [Bacteroidota bacterium]MDX5429893.1 hypothetical protein [Bacteroidota bacterium]MDX5468667.1 hypothetical protein [Bacteroidota bacterium]
MKKVFSIALIFLSLFASGQNYAIRHYTVTDGLPSGNIIQFYQDKKGFLWISTLAGISRFDGKNFVNYSLEDGLPFSYNADYCEDRKGDLYVQYGEGVARFDGVTFVDIRPAKGTTLFIRDLVQDEDGNILVIGREKLAKIINDSFIYFPSPDNRLLYCGIKTSDGRILIGGSDGIFEWKQGELLPYLNTPGEKVQSIHEDKEGYLWYGMLHNKVRRVKYGQKPGIPEEIQLPDLGGGFVAA